MEINVLKSFRQGRKGETINVADNVAEILIRKGFAEESESKSKLTAAEVAGLIEVVETKEGLEIYESDTRQIVVAAYKKKLKEFE